MGTVVNYSYKISRTVFAKKVHENRIHRLWGNGVPQRLGITKYRKGN